MNYSRTLAGTAKSKFLSLALLLIFSLPVHAGLLGDQVDMSVNADTQNGVTVDGTIEGSFTFGSDESLDIDVSDSSISIKAYDYTGFWQWTGDPVTVMISDLDFGAPFSFVTSEIVNDIGPIAWNSGADFISASFSGSTPLNLTGIVMDLQIDLVAQGVPEPATLTMLALGLAGLGMSRKVSKK